VKKPASEQKVGEQKFEQTEVAVVKQSAEHEAAKVVMNADSVVAEKEVGEQKVKEEILAAETIAASEKKAVDQKTTDGRVTVEEKEFAEKEVAEQSTAQQKVADDDLLRLQRCIDGSSLQDLATFRGITVVALQKC
jgi:hypothetical protein